jgi:uncharacterized protein YndB with AHSA1/START domain
MSERSVEHRTIVIERSYPASPERTFAAWADAEAKARRFGVSEGELELDFRVGGRERHRGTLPDGRVYTYQATYQDIIRPRRILYTYEMLLDGSRVSISLATAELTPEGDGTRLVFTEQGAFLDGHETPARRDQGRAACWTRWARSCRANKQPPERPTDSHRKRRVRLAQRSRPSARPSFSAGPGGPLHDRPPTWSRRTAVTDPRLSPLAPAGISPGRIDGHALVPATNSSASHMFDRSGAPCGS